MEIRTHKYDKYLLMTTTVMKLYMF